MRAISGLLIHRTTRLSSTSDDTAEKIRSFETERREMPQVPFVTEHTFHAGMYARTVRIPALTVLTNVLIKIPTLLIVHGCCKMLAGDKWIVIEGYQVIPGEAGRKTICVTATETEFTMIFATSATTVEEAEAEFTGEAENLISRSMENDIVVTEVPCLESAHPPRS